MNRPEGYEQAIGADTVAIVLRAQTFNRALSTSRHEAMRALADATGGLVIELVGDETLDASNAAEMREAGWVRRDDVAEILSELDDLDLDCVHELWDAVTRLNEIVRRVPGDDRETVPRPTCVLCGERPVEVEMEGRVLACRPCATDPTTAEHAAEDWR